MSASTRPIPGSRRLLLLLAVWFCLSSLGSVRPVLAARQGVTLTVQGPGQVMVDEQFEIVIAAATGLAADQGSLSLAFDSTRFRYLAMQTASDTPVTASGSDGQVRLSIGALPTGERRLATLVFTATAPGGGRFSITASQFSRDGWGLDASSAVYDYVSVIARPETAPSRTSTAPGTTTAADLPLPTVETVDSLPDETGAIATMTDPPPAVNTIDPAATTPGTTPAATALSGDSEPSDIEPDATGGLTATATRVGDRTDSPLVPMTERSQRTTTRVLRTTITDRLRTDPVPGGIVEQTTPTDPPLPEDEEYAEMMVIARRLERVVPLVLVPLIILIVAVVVALIVKRRP